MYGTMGKGKASRKVTGQKVAATDRAAKEMSASTEKTGSQTEKTEAAGKAAVTRKTADDQIARIFEERLQRHHDELRWLYMELYENDSMFAELCDQMYQFYLERNDELKKLDINREKDKDWYKKNDLLGMMFYIDNFSGNMKVVQSKLDYI